MLGKKSHHSSCPTWSNLVTGPLRSNGLLGCFTGGMDWHEVFWRIFLRFFITLFYVFGGNCFLTPPPYLPQICFHFDWKVNLSEFTLKVYDLYRQQTEGFHQVFSVKDNSCENCSGRDVQVLWWRFSTHHVRSSYLFQDKFHTALPWHYDRCAPWTLGSWVVNGCYLLGAKWTHVTSKGLTFTKLGRI